MKKICSQIITGILCICLLNACKKGFNDQQSNLPNPQQPDLTTQARVSVAGFVTDENGAAVFNAVVTAGIKSAQTDNYGYFKISDVSLSKTAPFISIRKEGYFSSYRTFVYKENEAAFTRIKLVPKTIAGTFNAATGGSATTIDGGIVSLPANAVVNAGTNAPYAGTVHVAAHLFKQDDANEFNNTAPGDNRGISSDGNLQIRKSYGMMAVELTGDAGELLQIAPGKEAIITTPIPAALTASAPATIPLWSFDVTKGLWKQESSATKNGNNYVGKVSHFSFWDGAVGVPLVNLTVQIVNTSLQPLGNVFVLVRRVDDPTSATTSYTNNSGIASGGVPANTPLLLEVYNTCGSAVQVLSQNFTTTNADIDLGTITANLGDQVTVTGTVVNCSNAPVSDGMIIMYVSNTPNSKTVYNTPVTNGSFTFSTAACPNMELTYVAIDNNANQQGTSQTTTLAAGSNNLGQLTACGTSTVSFINYSVDAGPMIMLAEPADTIYSSYQNGSGNIATIGTVQNLMPDLQFSYFGLNTLGSDHTVSDLWSISFAGPSHRARIPVPLPLTFTEFGDVGGFIAGSFSGNVENFDDGSPHTISCSFRVRRWN